MLKFTRRPSVTFLVAVAVMGMIIPPPVAASALDPKEDPKDGSNLACEIASDFNQCMSYCVEPDNNADDSLKLSTDGSPTLSWANGKSCVELTSYMLSSDTGEQKLADVCSNYNWGLWEDTDGSSMKFAMPVKQGCCACGGGIRENYTITLVVIFISIIVGCIAFHLLIYCCFYGCGIEDDSDDYECHIPSWGFLLFATWDWVTDLGFMSVSLSDPFFVQEYDPDDIDDLRTAAKIFVWLSLVLVLTHFYFADKGGGKSSRQTTALCFCEFVLEDFPLLVIQAEYFMTVGMEADWIGIASLVTTVVKVCVQICMVILFIRREDCREKMLESGDSVDF